MIVWKTCVGLADQGVTVFWALSAQQECNWMVLIAFSANGPNGPLMRSPRLPETGTPEEQGWQSPVRSRSVHTKMLLSG
jgi:hypothetical protein